MIVDLKEWDNVYVLVLSFDFICLFFFGVGYLLFILMRVCYFVV